MMESRVVSCGSGFVRGRLTSVVDLEGRAGLAAGGQRHLDGQNDGEEPGESDAHCGGLYGE